MSTEADKKERSIRGTEAYKPALEVNYIKALAQAGAKRQEQGDQKPEAVSITDAQESRETEKKEQPETNYRATQQVNIYRAAMQSYAKTMHEKGLSPKEVALVHPDDKTQAEADLEKMRVAAAADAARKKKNTRFSLRKFPGNIKVKPYEKTSTGIGALSAAIDARDRLQERMDENFASMSVDFAKTTHNIVSTYRNSRRAIAIALLGICIIASAILIIFDRFTVYEYAYNGKVLGYVKEQEEVSDVLEIAGEKLTENSNSSLTVEFIPNQNITFNVVDASNKSLDDSDIAVNKLVYMTDIETEAYGIYDGGQLVTIVRDQEEADSLIDRTLAELSVPDRGMETVSSEFDNILDFKPLNVLLTSVKDNTSALTQMTQGGPMEIYHIVEDGESVESLMRDYSVTAEDIYDNTNSEPVSDVMTGDKVCIHRTSDPVSVTMVERGRLRETVEFRTVKKETDEYYKGDTVTEQEGTDGIQIFEGTITKKSGEEVSREEENTEVIREVQDKIILVGTAERPKSAPTGTFAMPLRDRFSWTSPYGGRWGRLHAGVDLACPTGTPIYASDGGTVIRSSVYSGYGNCIDIDHGNGRVTRYAHCSKLIASVGDKVYQGQLIGLVGNTGNSYGSHLHFEIRLNDNPVDPAPYIGLS